MSLPFSLTIQKFMKSAVNVREFQPDILQIFISSRCNLSRVEVWEVISAEQRCFIVLTFFSADSENMINISAVFSESALFRTEQ